MSDSRSPRWLAATRAAVLLAIDPVGLKGVVLRGGPGPVRERWLALLQELMQAGQGSNALHRMPGNIDTDALLGGLDLMATLASGRRQWAGGLLARVGAGMLLVPMAERLAPGIAAMVGHGLRSRELRVQRDGFDRIEQVRFSVVACDETPDDEPCHRDAMTEQMAMVVDLHGISMQALEHDIPAADLVTAARQRLSSVDMPDKDAEALCAAALALGIRGMIAPILACRVARASAALSGYRTTGDNDLALASSLVFAQRATQAPAARPPRDESAEQASEDRPEAPPEQEASAPHDDGQAPAPEASGESPDAPPLPDDAPDADNHREAGEPAIDETTEIVIEAATAAIPAGLLAAMTGVVTRHAPSTQAGRFGSGTLSLRRGRPVGALRGRPGNGARLHLLETMRAAIPHQRMRQTQQAARAKVQPDAPVRSARLSFRPEDFRVRRYRQRNGSLSIFAVDASGSSALQRLAEAKGAIELLLADCYVRRDSVALIAFRGRAAQLLLPPTRSLTRARRELSRLPGGGGTPVASGLQLAATLIDNARRDGQIPALVVLTDGRANITLDGRSSRADANADAMQVARSIRARRVSSLVIDTSMRAGESARDIAEAMNATCLALPFADARALNTAVRQHRAAA